MVNLRRFKIAIPIFTVFICLIPFGWGVSADPVEGSFRTTEHDFEGQTSLEGISIDADLPDASSIEVKLYSKETPESEWNYVGTYTFTSGGTTILLPDDLSAQLVSYGITGTEGIKLISPDGENIPILHGITLRTGVSGFVKFKDDTDDTFDDNPPIEEATVEAWIGETVQDTAITDEDGFYKFTDLPDGSYNIRAYVTHSGTDIYNYHDTPTSVDVEISDSLIVSTSESLNIEFPRPVVMVHGILTNAASWSSTIDYLTSPPGEDEHQGYICFAVEGLHTGKGDTGWTYEKNALQIKQYMDVTVIPALEGITNGNPPAIDMFAHSQGSPITRCFIDKYGALYDIENLVMFSGVNGGVYRAAQFNAIMLPRYLDIMKVSYMYKFNGGSVGWVKAPKYVNTNGVNFHYVAAHGATGPSRFMEPSPNDQWVYWASMIELPPILWTVPTLE